ncbi:MAG: MarR family transcriptional regulator [Desulfobulbus propionicus]|nr:MAG: MarR family transcriptional regulator [Desulfobulbus propionicus]
MLCVVNVLYDIEEKRSVFLNTNLNDSHGAPDSVTNDVLIAIRKITKSISMNSKSLVKRVGLTGPQLLILQAINSTGEAAIGQVAKTICLSQATATGILERLEKRGLVTRRRSNSDRRRVLVQVTEAGQEVLASAPPLMQEEFISRFNNLQDWEQAMILSSLQRLVSLMDAKSIQAVPILAPGPIEEAPAKAVI